MTEDQAPWEKIKVDVAPANDVELPLAPPQRPLLLNALAIRFAHISHDGEADVVALEAAIPGDKLAQIAAALKPGRVEIALTSGFGSSRTLILSTAELLVLLTKGRQFIDELPR